MVVLFFSRIKSQEERNNKEKDKNKEPKERKKY